MHSILRLVAVVGVSFAALAASAQGSLMIAGAVYDDASALAVRSSFVPIPGVSVKLYRDDGDRLPSAGDSLLATATTDQRGVYVFRADAAAPHWVAVDSRTAGPKGAWADQTFGPAGALCAHPDGKSRVIRFEGPCFGGRTSAPDDASSFATSEHIALVQQDSAARNDFAFSFNVVTLTSDQGQGTLRQFVVNGNALPGPNRMRFVPIENARQQEETSFGLATRWWTVTPGSPLPELRDDDTVIDGTAFIFLSPASAADVHPGRVGERPTVRPEERRVPRLEKPELELKVTGAEGIACTGRCGVRALAIHGAPIVIAARADVRLEHVMIGSAPDGETASAGSVGIQVERGTTHARDVLITAQSRAGILVGPGARIDGERLDVSGCGDPQTGGGIVLASDGSSIRSSIIAGNPGAGVIIGSPDGSAPAHSNTVDGSTISGNQGGVILGPGSSRNVIARNDIMWNRLGGVAIAPYGLKPPMANRFSANRFDENGLRPIVLDLASETPHELARTSGVCQRNTTDANAGISPPRIDRVRVIEEGTAARAVIRGTACPGEIVEIYQSFVTSTVRNDPVSLPRIRNERGASETVSQERSGNELPSIGEFNYLGAATTAEDGTFEATFPLQTITPMRDIPRLGEEHNVWARDVLLSTDATDRAFSAIAIDPAGNTSEMGVRRAPDDRDRVRAK